MLASILVYSDTARASSQEPHRRMSRVAPGAATFHCGPGTGVHSNHLLLLLCPMLPDIPLRFKPGAEAVGSHVGATG